MYVQRRRRLGLALALLLTAPSLYALDQDAEIVALVEMPVATDRVIRVEAVPAVEVGDVAVLLNDLDLDPIDFLNVMRFLPLADVRGFLLGLRDSDIPRTELVEIVRYVPVVIEERVVLVDDRDDDVFDLDDYYALRRDEGLRGTALAAAIHEALRARGVPAGPKTATARPFNDGYIPDVVRQRAGRRAAVAGLPPGQAKKRGLDDDARSLPPGQAKKQELTRDRDDDRPAAKPDKKDKANRGRGAEAEDGRHVALQVMTRTIDKAASRSGPKGGGEKGNHGKGRAKS